MSSGIQDGLVTDESKGPKFEEFSIGSGDKKGQMANFQFQDTPVEQTRKFDEGTRLVMDDPINAKKSLCCHRTVLFVSWASVIFSLVTGVLGIVLSIRGKSEALFAYGLDAILDSLSSVAVVWRFYAATLHSPEREQRACIVVGISFLISAGALIGRSSYSIACETHESKQIILYVEFASVCLSGAIVLACFKLYLGLKISSRALTFDSIITFVGAISCLAGVIGLELYVNDSKLWYLDSVFGILLGLVLLACGGRLLYTILRN